MDIKETVGVSHNNAITIERGGIMNVAILTHDIKIKGVPANGKEAYRAVVSQLKSEIAERQEILDELSVPAVKHNIIKEWTPNKRNINITVYDK